MTEPTVASGVGELPTMGVADPRSDTITPTGEIPEAPIVEDGISEDDVKELQALLEEQRRIQSGLDRANSSLQDQVETSQTRIQELTTRLEAYNTADGATNDVLTDYMNQLEALAAERDQWQQQAEAAIVQESRVRIVASEFPGLTPLIDANALPQATDDESFRTSLLQLQDNFASAAELRQADHVRGVKPPAAPPASPTPDTDVLKRQMLKAEPGSETFNRAREQWYAALGVTS